MAIINAIRKTSDDNGVYQYVEQCNDTDYPTIDWEHNPDISAVTGIDKIYWEWNGSVVVEMSANDKALVNQALTQSTSASDVGGLIQVQNSGRVYCYTDDRWITDGDDNYGFGYYQFAESGLTGVDPVMEWEHQGHLVHKGDRLKRITISGRTTNIAVTEIEILLAFRTPTLETAFQSGYDNDGEMTNTTIYRDNWWSPNDIILTGPVFTGNTNDIHRRNIYLDFVFPKDGLLTFYYKPTNTSGSNYYFLHTYTFDILVGSE